MSVTAAIWNVVVVANWNRAIFTPSAVAKRLFLLTESDPVEVLVALDHLSPPTIKHHGAIVSVGGDRLIIQPSVSTWAKLQESKDVAKRAVEWLRETPYSAAGVNIRFVTDKPEEQLVRLAASDLDGILSQLELPILGRTIRRTLAWDRTRINIEVTAATEDLATANSYNIEFNFHFPSSSADEICEWLSRPISDIKVKVETLLNYLDEELEPTHDNEDA